MTDVPLGRFCWHELLTEGPDDAPRFYDGPSEIGEFSWHELATHEPDAAWGFYSELFGWQEADVVDLGEMGTYRMFSRGAHPLGGIFLRPPDRPVTRWLHYRRARRRRLSRAA